MKDGVGAEEDSLPKLNLDLLERAVNWAERSEKKQIEPDEPTWYQGSWGRKLLSKWVTHYGRNDKGHFTGQNTEKLQACGTAFCIAGYVGQVTGNAKWDGTTWVPTQEIVPYSGDVVKLDAECDVFWYRAGAAILGLTDKEAYTLFSANNSLARVKTISRNIAHSRGEYTII